MTFSHLEIGEGSSFTVFMKEIEMDNPSQLLTPSITPTTQLRKYRASAKPKHFNLSSCESCHRAHVPCNRSGKSDDPCARCTKKGTKCEDKASRPEQSVASDTSRLKDGTDVHQKGTRNKARGRWSRDSENSTRSQTSNRSARSTCTADSGIVLEEESPYLDPREHLGPFYSFSQSLPSEHFADVRNTGGIEKHVHHGGIDPRFYGMETSPYLAADLARCPAPELSPYPVQTSTFSYLTAPSPYSGEAFTLNHQPSPAWRAVDSVPSWSAVPQHSQDLLSTQTDFSLGTYLEPTVLSSTNAYPDFSSTTGLQPSSQERVLKCSSLAISQTKEHSDEHYTKDKKPSPSTNHAVKSLDTPRSTSSSCSYCSSEVVPGWEHFNELAVKILIDLFISKIRQRAGKASSTPKQQSTDWQSSPQESRAPGRKRKISKAGDDGMEDEGERVKRQKRGKASSTDVETKDLFACPFNKYDNYLFGPNSPESAYHVCGSSKFVNIAHLKQHLSRSHSVPKVYCFSCCRDDFDSEAALVSHMRARPACDVRDPPLFLERINSELAQTLKLNSRNDAGTDSVTYWNFVFDTLFPGVREDVDISPYFQFQSPYRDILDRFVTFSRPLISSVTAAVEEHSQMPSLGWASAVASSQDRQDDILQQAVNSFETHLASLRWPRLGVRSRIPTQQHIRPRQVPRQEDLAASQHIDSGVHTLYSSDQRSSNDESPPSLSGGSVTDSAHQSHTNTHRDSGSTGTTDSNGPSTVDTGDQLDFGPELLTTEELELFGDVLRDLNNDASWALASEMEIQDSVGKHIPGFAPTLTAPGDENSLDRP